MILVAGGSGFIGRSVVRRLVAGGREVAVMTAHPERSAAGIERLGARAVPGDVLEAGSLAGAVRGAESVVQVLTFPTFPVEKPARRFTFMAFDGLGTERLTRAAAEAGVRRYVYVSGVGAAPDAALVWFRAKARGERAVSGSGVDHAILRPSWIYGPGDRSLNRFLAFARVLPFVPVIGDGLQRVNPVLVDDVAEVVARAADPDGPGGTFEIGGPETLSMNEVLQTALDVMGIRRRLLHLPAWMPKLAGLLVQALPRPPLSPAAVDFATGDAVADTAGLLAALPDVRPRPLREGLATYLGRR